MTTRLRYRRIRPWKYQLTADLHVQLPAEEIVGGTARPIHWPAARVARGLVNLVDLRERGGMLYVASGYSWDGPSGPTIDTENFMRASLVHDALYQLIRAGLVPMSYRSVADGLLRDLAREDGMSRLRAWWVFTAVRAFGRKSAQPPLPV